jgi:hypothetical protein
MLKKKPLTHALSLNDIWWSMFYNYAVAITYFLGLRKGTSGVNWFGQFKKASKTIALMR